MDLRRMRARHHYGAVLQVFDGFLGTWEPEVLAALPAPWHDWLRSRSRRRFVQQDLRYLGLAPLPAIAPPRLRSAAAAWGSVYVMEGSALGGQVITRTLAEGGLHPERGAAYFHGWGEATAAMWRDFRALLDAQLTHPDAIAQAGAAACATFDVLSNLLQSALHERTPAA